jgi:hypothetical protein
MDFLAMVEAAVCVFAVKEIERREVLERREVVAALVVLAVEAAVLRVAEPRLLKNIVDLAVSPAMRVEEFEGASRGPGVLGFALHQSILDWIDLADRSNCCNMRAHPLLDSSATWLAETVVQATPSLTANSTMMMNPVNQGLASSFQLRDVAECARVERAEVLSRTVDRAAEDFWISIAALCMHLFVPRSVVIVVAMSHDFEHRDTEEETTFVSWKTLSAKRSTLVVVAMSQDLEDCIAIEMTLSTALAV